MYDQHPEQDQHRVRKHTFEPTVTDANIDDRTHTFEPTVTDANIDDKTHGDANVFLERKDDSSDIRQVCWFVLVLYSGAQYVVVCQ